MQWDQLVSRQAVELAATSPRVKHCKENIRGKVLRNSFGGRNPMAEITVSPFEKIRRKTRTRKGMIGYYR